jgi:O-acetylserine/cysteine efflux transporter
LAEDLLILLSTVAIALYYVLSVELIRRYSVITVAAISSIAGPAVLTPFAIWELRTAPVGITATGVGIVLYLAVLVTVIGIQVWLRALDTMPASLAATLQYLQPVVGVAAPAAIFGDPVGVWFVAGTGRAFLGIAWSTTAHLAEQRTPA